MQIKQTVSQSDLFKVLTIMDGTGIRYWLDGGWGVDVIVGEMTRNHRDVDIDFDSQYTEDLLRVLIENGYKVTTDCRPVRIELYNPDLSYIDIHPFILADDGSAKQADPDGGYFEFPSGFFTETVFQGRKIPCISVKGQKIFHTGYELREVDKHDITLIDKLLAKNEK